MHHKLKRAVQKLTGFWPMREVPMGADLHYDIRVLRNFKALTVFDVGANIGQSAAAYLNEFPDAKIHSFEPAHQTYSQLQKRFAKQPRVHVHNIALGSITGSGKMDVAGTSDMFKISDEGSEEIELQTLDGFCEARGISSINYMKVDTEGHDLEALRGAKRFLESHSIDLIEVEAGMNPSNDHHVPMERLKEFLEGFGYLLFGIYEQAREWPTGKPNMRRANLVFISPRAVMAG